MRTSFFSSQNDVHTFAYCYASSPPCMQPKVSSKRVDGRPVAFWHGFKPIHDHARRQLGMVVLPGVWQCAAARLLLVDAVLRPLAASQRGAKSDKEASCCSPQLRNGFARVLRGRGRCKPKSKQMFQNGMFMLMNATCVGVWALYCNCIRLYRPLI